MECLQNDIHYIQHMEKKNLSTKEVVDPVSTTTIRNHINTTTRRITTTRNKNNYHYCHPNNQHILKEYHHHHDDDDDDGDNDNDERDIDLLLLSPPPPSSSLPPPPFSLEQEEEEATSSHLGYHSPYHENDNNNGDRTTTTSMPFFNQNASSYDYTMVVTPRNSPTNCSNSKQSFSSNHHHKSYLGLLLCFVVAVSLPIVYHQFVVEEQNLYNDVVKNNIQSKQQQQQQPTTHGSTGTTANDVKSSDQDQPHTKTMIIIEPHIPYIYPTIIQEKTINESDNDDDDDSNNDQDKVQDDDDDTVHDDDVQDKDKDHVSSSLQQQQQISLYQPPNVAWFMSYPGSYGIVSHMIPSIEYYSNTTTATNYAATLLYPLKVDSTTTSSTTSSSSSSTTTNNNNNASQKMMNNNNILVNPIVSIIPNDQCGPFIHRWDIPIPTTTTTTKTKSKNSKMIITNTYCSTSATTSSSVVCTECIPIYHNALTYERACATGNRIYEQHYRSIQYDTRLPYAYIPIVQNPFLTIINRLRITFQQKIHLLQYTDDITTNHHHHHISNYFTQYQLNNNNNEQHYSSGTRRKSISIIDYCNYLDTTYTTLATTDLLDNYTHVPCRTEFYKYIQWYNDAVTLTSKYNNYTNNTNNDTDDDNEDKKRVHFIYYEEYIAALLQRRHQHHSKNGQHSNHEDNENHNYNNNDSVQALLDFLNLPMVNTDNDSNNIDTFSLFGIDNYDVLLLWNNETSFLQYFPKSILQKAANMIYELALPMTWELIRRYLEPYITGNDHEQHHSRFHFPIPHLRNHHNDQAHELIPMSFITDTNIPDDSTILSPLLFNDYRDTLYENAFHEYDNALLHPPEPNDPNPQVVWLLSFPNSGTSYTINNLEVTCNVTTGSNYAKDWEIIVPVRPELVNGPFIHNTELRIPHNVLTKTHCFGYCDDCGPRTYNITNNILFEQGCVRAERTNHSGSIRYENTVPVKAVHLYRSPFDNIVARMHLAVHKRQRQGNDVSLFTNSPEGLTAWCQYLDDKYSNDEEDFFSPTILQLFRSVPCHADWYRYVQWHNHAYIMTERLNLTVYDLYYEDYSHDYDRTLTTLFHYLNITPQQPSIDFYVGKSYENFFDINHARNAAILVHAISIPPVWLRLRHYFEDYM